MTRSGAIAVRAWRMVAVLACLSLALVACTGAPAGTPATVPATVSEPWPWALPHCVAYQPDDYPAQHNRLTVEVRPGPDTIGYVETYEPDWGARAMTELRELLRECGRYESGGTGDPDAFLEQHRITGGEFAGDDSLLVETTRLRPPEQQTWHTVVVRDGDVITTVRTIGSGEGAAAELLANLSGPEATCRAGQA